LNEELKQSPKEIWKFFIFHILQIGGKGAVTAYMRLSSDSMTLNPHKIIEGLERINRCAVACICFVEVEGFERRKSY